MTLNRVLCLEFEDFPAPGVMPAADTLLPAESATWTHPLRLEVLGVAGAATPPAPFRRAEFNRGIVRAVGFVLDKFGTLPKSERQRIGLTPASVIR